VIDVRTFEQTVNADLLEGRYLALELAALLDRLDEAAAREGRRDARDDRMKNLGEAIAVISKPSAKADRAERILRIYSDPE
jgi:hypothetical protein